MTSRHTARALALAAGCLLLASGCGREGPASPPIFLVVADTLRADAALLAAESDGALSRLARDGIVFEAARAPSSWTRPAVVSLLTGLSSARHQVRGRLDVLSGDVETLAQVLARHGYRGHGWSTNPNVLALWGLARGFEEFVDLSHTELLTRKTDAERVFELARARVSENGAAPAFYYLHLMDPHHPYEPDREAVDAVREAGLLSRFPGPATAGPRIRDAWLRYLGEVRDLDRKLAGFLAFLEERDLYSRSVILLVSDHGEEFLDHGGRFHGHTLHEEMLRAVAILKQPGGREAGRRVSTPIALRDLMPAVLEAAGLPVPPGLDAHPPLPPAETSPRDHFATLSLDGRRQSALLRDGWKLIVDHATGREQLFDLSRDPDERLDRRESQPERAAALRRALDARRADHASGWHVLACGTAAPATLSFQLFQLAAAGAAPALHRLEEEDHVSAPDADGAIRAELSLAPAPLLDTGRARAERVTVRDADELVLRVADDLGLAAPPGERLDVALGDPPVWRHAATLQVAAAEARAAARPGGRGCLDPGELPPQLAGRPHLRVWHVPSVSEALPAEDLDPDLRERLRALGYGS